MEFESIYTITEAEKLDILRDIIYTIRDLKPGLIISSLRYENIGDDVIISFRIDADSYSFMVEKLIYNNVRLLIVDKKNEDLMESIQKKIHQANSDFIGWGASKNLASLVKSKSLEELVENGNYREVIRLSKNFASSNTIIEKAKNNISPAIFVAIDTAFQDGLRNQIEIDNSIEKLIEIASDKNLKVLNKIDELKRAGFLAIELCTQRRDNYSDLIHIANNSSLHNIINIKAAIRFSQLILSDTEQYDEEIQLAVRKLNTRWLSIAMDIVEKDLSDAEVTEFKKFFNFIVTKRNAVS